MMRLMMLVAALAFYAGQPLAKETTKLFASDEVIDIRIAGPINELARTAHRKIETYPATLSYGSESHMIDLSPRGNARRSQTNCEFPPLRVRFQEKPSKESLFHKQGSLKLVTHCQRAPSFQQLYLLEYAAYKMYETLTPASFKVRLANVSYIDGKSGKEILTRTGFFIEDVDDVAARNSMKEVEVEKITLSQHDKSAAARSIMFFHMIGNHDWSMMSAGLESHCCHNGKLIGATADAASGLVYIPYDFDYAGFVGAPYAVPPDAIKISSVKKRFFRGSCQWNDEFSAQAATFRAKRPEIYAAVANTPGLTPANLKKANAYLDGFFKEIGDTKAVEANILKKCRK